jgi:hypothetical protein
MTCSWAVAISSCFHVYARPQHIQYKKQIDAVYPIYQNSPDTFKYNENVKQIHT